MCMHRRKRRLRGSCWSERCSCSTLTLTLRYRNLRDASAPDIGLAVHELYQECIATWGKKIEGTVKDVFEALWGDIVADAINTVCSNFGNAESAVT